jgi:hydroxyacylglutathione hydrolase
MFRRFFDEGLAQSSYLLACDRTRTAVVIDPGRDIDEPVLRIPQVSAAELRDRQAVTMVDVRSEREWRAGHIDGALHGPVGENARRAAEIPRHRSGLASSLLTRHGVTNLVNVAGGMSAWRVLLPVTP